MDFNKYALKLTMSGRIKCHATLIHIKAKLLMKEEIALSGEIYYSSRIQAARGSSTQAKEKTGHYE
jgi:hypothetical protein